MNFHAKNIISIFTINLSKNIWIFARKIHSSKNYYEIAFLAVKFNFCLWTKILYFLTRLWFSHLNAMLLTWQSICSSIYPVWSHQNPWCNLWIKMSLWTYRVKKGVLKCHLDFLLKNLFISLKKFENQQKKSHHFQAKNAPKLRWWF